ncbi:MAG: serine/threonine-protein kinase [Sandaracinus sp.]
MERGRVIGEKYELVSPIGEGGMGVVWRAKHVTLGREVALKRVIGGESASEVTLQRFLREAQSAAAVRAPNVVDVIDYGRDTGGDPYLVMELLDGESLEHRLKRPPPLGLDEVLDLVDQALVGLTAIHDAGIVHRDLKPANLFLAKAGEAVVVKVLDFGIARPAAPEASALTHTMQTLGTPHYMSPEQVRSAKNVDARCDVYAMGVILFQVVTGRLPFEGPSATAIIAAIVTEDPPTIRSLRPDVPPLVSEVIQRAMSRRVEDRFADARALREALVAARRGETLPGVEIGRISVTAPTVVMDSQSTAKSGAEATAPKKAPPPSRTGRRGFFALFGMLGTAAAAGLAFLATQRTGSAPSVADLAPSQPATAVAVGEAVEQGASGGAGGGGEWGTGSVPRGAMPGSPAPPPAPPSESAGLTTGDVEPTVPMVIGDPVSLAELAGRWRQLDPADRAALFVRPLGDGYVLATASEGTASRVAAALETQAHREGTPAPATAILTPRLFRTNARSNVRRGPSQEHGLIATVADDGLLVGMLGTIEGQASGDQETEGWVRVFASSTLDGWTARRLLEEDGRCAPRRGSFVASEVLARVTLREDGREYDAFLAVDTRSARIYETDAMCNLVERHTLRTAGAIAESFVTELSDHGESVLVIGEWPAGRVLPDGRQTWSARTLTDLDEVLWQTQLASGQNLLDARREGLGGPFSRGPHGSEGFFPLRIRRPHERVWLVWDAERRTFVPAADEPSATPVTED